MDGLTYLIGDLILCGLLVLTAAHRKDLRAKMPFLGLLGGCAAVIGELFFYRDYWRPPDVTLLPLEDFVFGFIITAASFSLYAYLFGLRFAGRTHPRRLKLYAGWFMVGLISMLVFNVWLGIPSMFANIAILGVFSAVIMTLRRDLWRAGLYSAIGGIVIMALLYALFFDIFEPTFWRNYWLFAGTPWGITVLGNVPVTELLWYGAWFLFAGMSYPFVSGREYIPLKQIDRSPEAIRTRA